MYLFIAVSVYMYLCVLPSRTLSAPVHPQSRPKCCFAYVRGEYTLAEGILIMRINMPRIQGT